MNTLWGFAIFALLGGSLNLAASHRDGFSFETLYTFWKGYPPHASVAVGNNGVLYGTTDNTVFALHPPPASGGKWTMETLYTFSQSNLFEYWPVVIGKDGTLYGVTMFGGSGGCLPGCGTVFSLTPPAVPGASWTFAAIHEFMGIDDGFYPSAGLTLGPSGELFGTAGFGGLGGGVAFEMTPPVVPGGTWSFQVLYSFKGAPDVAVPDAPLTIAGDGSIYGVGLGGPSTKCDEGCGTVFKLSPPAQAGGAWTEDLLYGFEGGRDGAGPTGVVVGANGVLYGVTSAGGTFAHRPVPVGTGVFFSLSPPTISGGTWSYTAIQPLRWRDGVHPWASLIGGPNATFYGAASRGGTYCMHHPNRSCGTLFELHPPASAGGTWRVTVIYEFQGRRDDYWPFGTLVRGKKGDYYGTTGAQGSVFRIYR